MSFDGAGKLVLKITFNELKKIVKLLILTAKSSFLFI